MRHQFEANDGSDECGDKKYSPEVSRVVENKYSNEYGAYCADACPHCVGGSYGEGLCGFHEEYHTNGEGYQKGAIPKVNGAARCRFCFAKARGESYFKESGDNEDDPGHGRWLLVKM